MVMPPGSLGNLALEEFLNKIAPDAGLKNTPTGALLVGNFVSKIHDEFLTFDTTNDWLVVSNPAANQPITLGGLTSGSRYLNINSGVVGGDDTVILSRMTFKMPVKLVVGLSMSQRIDNTTFDVGIVEVDESGNIVDDVSIFTGPNCLNAKNACLMSFYGSSTTNGQYVLRSSGVSELIGPATSYGTTHMAATGTGPDYMAKNQFEILAKHDLVAISSRGVNSTASATAVLNRTDYLPDPDALYAIMIRVRNTAVPASATDCRVHFVKLVDSASLSVDFSVIGGSATDQMAAPVRLLNTPAISGTVTANVGTSGITQYTDSGTNLAIGATFTGTSRDQTTTPGYNLFVANAYSDVAGTLRIEKSTDGTTWRKAAEVALAAGEAKELVIRSTTRYSRVVFVNGATAQTAFSLTSAYQRQ